MRVFLYTLLVEVFLTCVSSLPKFFSSSSLFACFSLNYICIATEILPERDFKTRVWDVMYSSKLELVSGKRSGRLLQYDPSTDTTTVLVKGLLFANGISIDPSYNENYILFTETYSIRVGKYYLTGDKVGTVEYIVDGAPLPACKFACDRFC